MNLLQLVQEFCGRVGLPKPATVMSSQDTQYLQLVGILNEVIDYVITRDGWEWQQLTATFASTGNEEQGYLYNLATLGYMWIVEDTFFPVGSMEKVVGPITAREWATMHASNSTPVKYGYRLKEGKLYISPAAPATQSFTFEYVSDFTVTNALHTTWQKYFALDDDVCSLPDTLLLAGLKTFWKRESGFRYSEDFITFEGLVTMFFSKDGTKRNLSMAPESVRGPGIMIPSGNWSL